MVLEQQRAPGGAQAGGGLQVLEPDGQAAEQSRVVAALDGIADRFRLPAAASASMATMAFTAALVASMRLRQLSISSSGDSCRAPIMRRASTAVRSQASLMPPPLVSGATRTVLVT